MTHTTEQLAAFSATTEAEQLIIKNAIGQPLNTGASQVLADEIGSEDLTQAEIDESNTGPQNPTEFTQEDLDAVAAAVLADSGPAVSPASLMAEKVTMDGVRNSKAFKIDSTKVDPTLLAMFEEIMSRAVAEKISGVKAVQMVMTSHPTATRVAIKHTAALVGINPLSARNAYDKFNK